MNIKAHAKINLNLEIVGTDEREYHLLRTVMQSLMLCDDIDISVSEDGRIHLEMQDERGAGSGMIPCDKDNLMYRAAELMRKRYHISDGVRMKLTKRIPSEAGLGGGSADAAAVMKGMNELFGLGLCSAELEEAGLTLGADIPYCIRGGTALAEGIGERLTNIDSGCRLYVLIVKPKEGMSTPKVYAAYDATKGSSCDATGDAGMTMDDNGIISTGAARPKGYTKDLDTAGAASHTNTAEAAAETVGITRCVNTRQEHETTDELIKALETGDCTSVYQKIKNVLEPPATDALPLIGRVKSDLISFGAEAAAMTGSGSAVYGLFSDRGALELVHKGFSTCDYIGEISDIIETEFT